MAITTISATQLDDLDKNGESFLRPSPPAHLRSQEVLVEASSTESTADNDFSKGRSAAIIITVAGVNFLNTLGSGTLTVALPAIAKDLGLSRELLLWPASIYAWASFGFMKIV